MNYITDETTIFLDCQRDYISLKLKTSRCNYFTVNHLFNFIDIGLSCSIYQTFVRQCGMTKQIPETKTVNISLLNRIYVMLHNLNAIMFFVIVVVICKFMPQSSVSFISAYIEFLSVNCSYNWKLFTTKNLTKYYRRVIYVFNYSISAWQPINDSLDIIL